MLKQGKVSEMRDQFLLRINTSKIIIIEKKSDFYLWIKVF